MPKDPKDDDDWEEIVVKDANKKDAGGEVGGLASKSRFEKFISLSVTRHLFRQTQPVLYLDKQFRAVNGQLDPVLAITYKSIPFTYADDCDPKITQKPSSLRI